ncbi:MAG: hypothetical protein ACJATU_000938 [Rickettsiales bacterium]
MKKNTKEKIKTQNYHKSLKYLRVLSANRGNVMSCANRMDIFWRLIGDIFYMIADDGIKSQNNKIEIFDN